MKLILLLSLNTLLYFAVWLHERKTNDPWGINLFFKVHGITIILPAVTYGIFKPIVFAASGFFVLSLHEYLTTVKVENYSKIDIILSVFSIALFYLVYARDGFYITYR